MNTIRTMMNIFQEPQEKGHEEWATFSPVRGDKLDAYPISLPKHPIVVRERGNILRIMHPYSRSIRSAH